MLRVPSFLSASRRRLSVSLALLRIGRRFILTLNVNMTFSYLLEFLIETGEGGSLSRSTVNELTLTFCSSPLCFSSCSSWPQREGSSHKFQLGS